MRSASRPRGPGLRCVPTGARPMTTDDQLAEDVRGVLEGAGLTDRPEEYGDGIHGWRCEHPDRYGRCDCLSALIDDLVRLVRDCEAAAWDDGEASVELTDEGWRV